MKYKTIDYVPQKTETEQIRREAKASRNKKEALYTIAFGVIFFVYIFFIAGIGA